MSKHHDIADFVQSIFHLFLLSFCHIITKRLGRAGIITSISQMERLKSKEVTSSRSQLYYGWNSTLSLALLPDLKKELDKKVWRRESRSLLRGQAEAACGAAAPRERKGEERLRHSPVSASALQGFILEP